jgi:hypothetical protein
MFKPTSGSSSAKAKAADAHNIVPRTLAVA